MSMIKSFVVNYYNDDHPMVRFDNPKQKDIDEFLYHEGHVYTFHLDKIDVKNGTISLIAHRKRRRSVHKVIDPKDSADWNAVKEFRDAFFKEPEKEDEG